MALVLVCGGRDFVDKECMNDVLRERTNVGDTILSGCAKGADTLAILWALKFNRNVKRMPADWAGQGRGAGFARNAAMIAENPDLVIAFPGGNGTAHTVRLALARGIETVVVAKTD